MNRRKRKMENGSGFHDDFHDGEEGFGDAVNHAEERRALLTERDDGKGHENGDEKYLEEIAGDEGLQESFGDDVEQETDGAQGFGALRITLGEVGIEGAGIDVKAVAGADDVDDDEAD
jgi:hypothetical protein